VVFNNNPMQQAAPPRALVVNFNAPELHQLALALAGQGRLTHSVRPYANQGRLWERALAALPGAGRVYAGTLGRRRLIDAGLIARTLEAGVLADFLASAVGRLPALPPALRQRWSAELHKRVRLAIEREGAVRAPDADCVIAYEGFALPAFQALGASGHAVLNYPVAHHRQRRRVRDEENAREPAFAATWPGFDDWPAGHEARLDAEIERADAVFVGSGYARDSFIAEGVAAAKMRVVPYGVDLGTFCPAPTERPARSGFKAIFAGQLTQRKGLSYLLRGYRRFQRADSRLSLVGSLVGGPRPLAPYADLFEHVPHQTRPGLAQRYREADVFVFPTLVEGMPLVVLEAMACGLPVIVTANGPGDIVRDGVDGFVIPERDEEAVADRLDRLYRDRELCRHLGRNAAGRAREFTWAAYAGAALACLAQLETESRR
jgi:glycosyltransferase involved in cell wall biosynthesis